jgi:hypothetical protein
VRSARPGRSISGSVDWATKRIQTGDLIGVDGTAGTVTVPERAGPQLGSVSRPA